jgi:hypothetical protein
MQAAGNCMALCIANQLNLQSLLKKMIDKRCRFRYKPYNAHNGRDRKKVLFGGLFGVSTL